MKKLLYQINTILSQNSSINPKEFCIFGISGGQDSIFLFFIFLHLKKQWNINIQIIHFHHFWQKKNFFSTQQLLKLSFLFKISLYIIPSELVLQTEKKARQWRQKGFNRVSSIEKTTKILTGHTGSDRIETAFWHLIRGTSPQGLLSLKLQTQLKNQILFFNYPKFIIFYYVQIGLLTIFTIKSILPISQILKQKFVKKKSKVNFIYKTRTNKKKINNKHSFHSNNTALFLCFKKLCFLKQKGDLHIETKKSKFCNDVCLQLESNCKQTEHNSFFCLPKQEKTYCFLIFNLWFSKKHFLRPLLLFHRTDVTFFSKKYSFPIVFDPSNHNLRWFRNRIRHQLFPIVRFFFNPSTEYNLTTFLEISSEEQKYSDYVIQQILQYWLKKYQKNRSFIFLDFQFKIFPKGLQTRLLQRLFQSFRKVQLTSVQIQIVRNNIYKN